MKGGERGVRGKNVDRTRRGSEHGEGEEKAAKKGKREREKGERVLDRRQREKREESDT